jgi:hypothetical protein
MSALLLALPAMPEEADPEGPLPLPPPAEPVVQVESAWVVSAADGTAQRLVSGEQPEGAVEELLSGRFRYQGNAPAVGLRIVMAVPQGRQYVPGSAVGPGAELSYSTDGGRNFDGLEPLHAAEVSHIRWDLPGTHPPGTAGLVSFRVRPREARMRTTSP